MRILCFSDTHVGSLGGILRPHFQAGDSAFDNRVGNKIWRFFEKVVSLEKNKIDAIFFCGDLLHGIPRDMYHSQEVLIPSLDLQRRAAIYTIGDILPDDIPKFACTGSHYHDAEEIPFEAGVLNEMGFRVVEQFKSVQLGKYFINLAHSKGTREQLSSYLEKTVRTLRGMGNWFQVILRGHYHRFTAVRFPECIAVCLPCLEDGSKRYSLSVSTFPFSADIGMVVIDIDNDFALKYYKFEK